MKLISGRDFPYEEGEETDDWSLKFEFEGYVYYMGQLDGPPGWFCRMSVEDYESGSDRWEKPGNWIGENSTIFKFLK